MAYSSYISAASVRSSLRFFLASLSVFPFIRESPAIVIIRSASIWMLASTVFADCLAIGCRLSSRMFLAKDCRASAIIPQHTTTNTKILRVVLLNILLFRLLLAPRLREPVPFLATFLISPFPKISLMGYSKKSPFTRYAKYPYSTKCRAHGWDVRNDILQMGAALFDIVYHTQF